MKLLNTLASDEMDLQLILEGVEDFLFFNTEDQSVEMRNLPPGHPLERFQEGNKLDVKKYFKEVEIWVEIEIFHNNNNIVTAYT